MCLQFHVTECDAIMVVLTPGRVFQAHDDVIQWKHFPGYWQFVRRIHQSPVNSPYKGQWRGALMFSLICAGINGWVNNDEAGDLRRHHAHYDVTLMHCRLYNLCWKPDIIVVDYNMVGSALFLQRALYTVHCTNTMHSRKPSFAITPAVFS